VMTEGLGIHWMLRAVVGMGVFVLLAWGMKTLDPEEIELIKTYTRKGMTKFTSLFSRAEHS